MKPSSSKRFIAIVQRMTRHDLLEVGLLNRKIRRDDDNNEVFMMLVKLLEGGKKWFVKYVDMKRLANVKLKTFETLSSLLKQRLKMMYERKRKTSIDSSLRT